MNNGLIESEFNTWLSKEISCLNMCQLGPRQTLRRSFGAEARFAAWPEAAKIPKPEMERNRQVGPGLWRNSMTPNFVWITGGGGRRMVVDVDDVDDVDGADDDDHDDDDDDDDHDDHGQHSSLVFQTSNQQPPSRSMEPSIATEAKD